MEPNWYCHRIPEKIVDGWVVSEGLLCGINFPSKSDINTFRKLQKDLRALYPSVDKKHFKCQQKSQFILKYNVTRQTLSISFDWMCVRPNGRELN